MEFLTATYVHTNLNTWVGTISNYPDIKAIAATLQEAQENLYYLVTNEIFHRTGSFNGWTIATEIIKYIDIDTQSPGVCWTSL